MKLDRTSSLFAQAATCALALLLIILLCASVTVSGLVLDADEHLVNDAFINLWNGFGDRLIFNNLHTSATTTQTLAPTTASAPAYKPNTQVKYAKTTYNMFPVIQMNLSWKRASKYEPIDFDAGSTYDPDGYIMAYEWDFGDGSMAIGHTARHAYKDMGRYSIRLRVVDNSGADRYGYLTAIISNKPPVALPGNDSNVTVGETLALNGSASYDPDGRVVRYEWSFGDGTTGEGVRVNHSYDRPDKYKIELKVTDDSGSNSTASMAVSVAGIKVSTTPSPTAGGSSGIALLAGAGVACVALMILMRKKGK